MAAAIEKAGQLGIGKLFALTLERLFFEKLGFATRDVAESVLPTMAGALAIPAHYMGPEAMRSPEFINKVPLFSYRNTAFAQKGKSSVGSGSAQSLENPQEKIMQKYASLLGVSLNPVNLTTKKK